MKSTKPQILITEDHSRISSALIETLKNKFEIVSLSGIRKHRRFYRHYFPEIPSSNILPPTSVREHGWYLQFNREKRNKNL